MEVKTMLLHFFTCKVQGQASGRKVISEQCEPFESHTHFLHQKYSIAYSQTFVTYLNGPGVFYQ